MVPKEEPCNNVLALKLGGGFRNVQAILPYNSYITYVTYMCYIQFYYAIFDMYKRIY